MIPILLSFPPTKQPTYYLPHLQQHVFTSFMPHLFPLAQGHPMNFHSGVETSIWILVCQPNHYIRLAFVGWLKAYGS